MGLKKALDDCLIDFDCRVVVTDLLEEYKLSYKEVNDTLEAYIKEQEPATKFEKRFLVHGTGLTNGTNDEFYTIVQESKLEDWRRKLRDAQWQLYSVEIAGGSKSPATVFRPMQHLEVKLAGVERRAGTRIAVDRATNGVQVATNGAQRAAPVMNGGSKAANGVKSGPEKPSSSKENSEPKTSPKEQPAKAKPAKKGSINSFFTAAAAGAGASAAGSKSKEVKATPSKANTMDNFFKKQPAGGAAATAVKKSPESLAKKSPESQAKKSSDLQAKKSPERQPKKSPPIQAKKESTANTSIQLFADESAESSDEEEKLDKIRRKVMASDNESDQEKPASSKRRRISDSEDEGEQQPNKKTAEEEVITLDDDAMETDSPNETFLDDDGFVVTQRKPTKPAKALKKKASPSDSAPAAKKKGSPSDTKKKSPPAASKVSKEATKSKQGNIMSFFTKK